jgi:hypothetical protein
MRRANERGVEEPEKYRLRIIEQARRAAELLARGGDDVVPLPPEIREQVAEWRAKLDERREQMDEEGWLIGLLTLACLPPRVEGACR